MAYFKQVIKYNFLSITVNRNVVLRIRFLHAPL